jgi:hypothetical protein
MTKAQRTHDETDDETDTAATDHLDEVEDGAGCTEIWEHLSEQRDTPVDD